MKRFWRAETGFFVITFLALMIAGRSRMLRDPGPLWHVAVGRHILAAGEIIRSDPYSFSLQDPHWIAWQWLLACPLALIHGLCGLDGLVLATATALSCLYSWIAHRLLRAGFHWLLAAAVVALTAAASSYHFHPRPHLVTMILLAWTFARLCDFEAARITLRQLWAFVPVFAVWANVHGGVLGGIGSVALAVAGWTVAKPLGQRTPLRTRKDLVLAYALLILCGSSVFVSPFGVELPGTWLAVLRSQLVANLMQEHAPLFATTAAVPVALFAAVYSLVLIGTLSERPRVTWLIPLAWFVLACARVRHGPLFAVTAVLAIVEIFPHCRWAQWLHARGSDLYRGPATDPGAINARWDYRPTLLPLVLVLVCVVFQACSLAVPVVGSGWAKLDARQWPVALLPELQKRQYSRSEGTPIFNDMLYGGFLIYFTPGYRVFIDDRCELYGHQKLLDGRNALEAYAEAADSDPACLERWSKLYGFDLALVQTGSVFDRHLASAPNWVSLARTPTAGLYERRQVHRDDIAANVNRETGTF